MTKHAHHETEVTDTNFVRLEHTEFIPGVCGTMLDEGEVSVAFNREKVLEMVVPLIKQCTATVLMIRGTLHAPEDFQHRFGTDRLMDDALELVFDHLWSCGNVLESWRRESDEETEELILLDDKFIAARLSKLPPQWRSTPHHVTGILLELIEQHDSDVFTNALFSQINMMQEKLGIPVTSFEYR